MSRRLPWGQLALAVAVLLAPSVLSEQNVNLLNFVGLYTTVAVGLVLLTGFTGQASLGHAAFYGIGAYASAILAGTYGWNPWLAIPAAAAVTAALAYLVGIPTLRLSGHYLSLATIALVVIAEQLFRELDGLTGGANGFTDIPGLVLFGQDLGLPRRFYYLIWAVALASLLLGDNLVRSRTGRALRAIRSTEAGAAALGIPVASLKLQVFVLSAVLASVAGSLYAFLIFFISPQTFGLAQSIRFLTMAVVGGVDHVWGALLGAGLLQLLDLRLQDVMPLLFGREGRYEVIVYGLLLAVMTIVAPHGIWPWVARPFARFARPPALPAGPGLSELDGRPAIPLWPGPDLEAPVLELRGATRAFGGLVAVNDLSFEVRQGEIVGLIGPNGAGKSTAFNLITGVHELTAGEIVYRGQRLDGRPPHRIARLGVFRTFQNTALFESMTVLENAMTGVYTRTRAGLLAGLFHAERAEEARTAVEAHRALDSVGLAPDAFASAGALPVGRRRLLEVGRALAGRPDLLLLDEPAAGLRHAEKGELVALLSSLRDRGLTILLVEHDMDLVMRLADRIVVMSYGQKIASGTPAEVQSNEAVIEAYLGREVPA